MKIPTQQYLSNLTDALVNKNNKHQIILTRDWARQFPKEAGVYVLFEGDELVYTGETSSIRERVTDYLNTMHHTVRRKIGAFKDKYPLVPIAADGHVAKETVGPYVKAGATILCANTSIFGQGDAVENYRQMQLLAEAQ